jgi:hypothetical protein
MALSCREQNAIDLEGILRKIGPTSLGIAAKSINRGVAYTRSIVEQFPDKFDLVGVSGKVSTWCVGVSDPKNPIQFVIADKLQSPE